MPIYSGVTYYKYSYSSWTQPTNPSGITATSGWENPGNAFDKNANTYARCGTLTDYIEWNLGTEILLSGMSATGQYASSVARACNMSICSVDDQGREVLLGNGTGATNSGTYTTSVSFNAVWVKRLRFRLIAGNDDPTTTYKTRIREITLVAHQQRKITNGTSSSYDFYEYNKIKQIVNSNLIKYYKYIIGAWTQPVLTSNGTFGGNTFAVSSNIPYECYNGSKYVNGVNENSHFEFYNPVPIKVNTITITSSDSKYAQRAGYVSYSDDNINWIKSNDWTNPSNNPYVIPVSEQLAHKYWQVYFTQRGTTGNADINSVRVNAVTKTVQESNKNDYDYRELNQIAQVYSGSDLVFFLGGKIDHIIDNPSSQVTEEIDIQVKGVYKLWLVSGGNSYNWCYVGCNYAGSGAGFIGKLKFNTKCHLRLIVGGQRQDSILQVAPWGNKTTWYNLVLATSSKDNSSGDPRYSVGTISVNRSSSFNTFLEIELEENGNNGTTGGYGASVWNGYGSGGKNGYGRLQFIRSK